MNIKGCIAVISGGASGLGQACVAHLRALGATAVIWDLNRPAGEDYFFECDVSQESAVEQALSKTIEGVGVPRIAINCAGIAPAKRMVGKEGPMPLQAFKRVIDINLVGSFNVMRVLASVMKELPLLDEERGVIINTASIAAMEGQIGQTAYSASKGGIIAMTLPAARELADDHIRVNCIAPGLMATPLLLNMAEAVQTSLAACVTFPKRFGRPEEFARLVQHIIENPYLNGEVIRLDGALRMQAR